jgi:hypothetical protein
MDDNEKKHTNTNGAKRKKKYDSATIFKSILLNSYIINREFFYVNA